MSTPQAASEIVLCTLNARFIHASFGLRCLLANLGPLQPRATLAEFDINQRPLDIVDSLLRHQPRIIGLGVYVWNTTQTRLVVQLLKQLAPHVTIILGGPEISHETHQQPLAQLANHIITGEADLAFATVCQAILAGSAPPDQVIHAPLPDLAQLAPPYSLYTDQDLAQRIVYVEASRGCPFSCEFCLSSLDIPVRQFPLDSFLASMQGLLDRGLHAFKFVDRTFNLNLHTSQAILRFFLERWRPDLFLHFEMIPDRLPAELRDLIRQFPPGSLQFEVGIQTFNPDVAARISRRQDPDRTRDNLRFLRTETGVHLHADLIAGLPGESLESFASGFNQLLELQPHEIQVGILKRLRGTPISRHDAEWNMRYNPEPPYDLLASRTLDFPTMQRLRRFARYWDLYANSGNFLQTAPLLWSDSPSPFHSFLQFSDWLFETAGRQHALALDHLAELLFQHLTTVRRLAPDRCAAALALDYHRTRRDIPSFLRTHLPTQLSTPRSPPRSRSRPNSRQNRHL